MLLVFNVYNWELQNFKYSLKLEESWKQNPHFGGNRYSNSFLVETPSDFAWRFISRH